MYQYHWADNVDLAESDQHYHQDLQQLQRLVEGLYI